MSDMSRQVERDHGISRGAMYFGLLGGGIAWTLHLLLAYAIAEFGCLAGWGEISFMGITAVAWLLLLLSTLMLLAAAAATYVSWRSDRGVRARGGKDSDPRGPAIHLARAGLIMSGLFVFIIIVESVPIFFYLQRC